MSNLPALLLELEKAVNAVEPRVLKGWKPGLSDEEIDAIMANVPFRLPDDLRELYKWKTPLDFGYSYLGALWHAIPLAPNEEVSNQTREELREDWEREGIALPLDLESIGFLDVFYDGAGSELVALCFPNQNKTCEIRCREKGGAGFSLMFRGVEPMIRTALEWWKNGVFHSPYEHRLGWGLETDFDKKSEFARRLNPDCAYWLS